MSRRAILITDGEQRAALALVRAYGGAGHRVFVCSARQSRSLAGASRYCLAQARVADPLHDPSRFVTDLRALVGRWKIDVVVPVTDASLGSVLPRRAQLGDVVVPFADADTYRRASDKAYVLGLAPRFGIRVPRQVAVRDRFEASSMDPNSLEYPIVLKPSRSVTDGAVDSETGAERLKLGVTYARNADELRLRLAELDTAAFPVLLQQRVSGDGVGVFLLLWNGKLIAQFSHRRLREKPPSGGVSVYCESIAADSQLVERSLQLLRQLTWQGVAMVEYKIDRSTGDPYLMEINGRFWGSLQLAIDAGVDFPNILLALAIGDIQPQPVLHYRTGVRARWWWGDIDHLLTRLRRSAEDLALPPNAPTRWRVLRDFLHPPRGRERNEVLRWSDPAPFLRESIDWIRRR